MLAGEEFPAEGAAGWDRKPMVEAQRAFQGPVARAREQVPAHDRGQEEKCHHELRCDRAYRRCQHRRFRIHEKENARGAA